MDVVGVLSSRGGDGVKSEVNPVVGGIVVVLLLAIVGFFLWRGTAGSTAKPAGAVGNPGPFAPGGPANSRGAKPAGGGPGSPPGMPAPGANPSGR
jgi:hypothetical protein